MGSLVWSALAKGAGDLGNVISNGMYKQADLMFQQQKEIDADSRAMKRAEALERLKVQLEEEQNLADSKKMVEVRSKADEIAAARITAADNKAVGGLIARQSAIAGDAPAASEQEMRDLLKDPNNRKVYEDAGYIDKASTRNPLLQRADDLISAASDAGASSRVRKSLEQARKDTLAEIKEENKEANAKADREQGNRRLDVMEAKLDEQSRHNTAMEGIGNKNANANQTRADNGGPAGNSATLRGLQAESTAASRAVTDARKDVSAKQKVYDNSFGDAKVAAGKALEAAQGKLDSATTSADDVARRLKEFNKKNPGVSNGSTPSKPLSAYLKK